MLEARVQRLFAPGGVGSRCTNGRSCVTWPLDSIGCLLRMSGSFGMPRGAKSPLQPARLAVSKLTQISEDRQRGEVIGGGLDVGILILDRIDATGKTKKAGEF